MMFFLLLLSIHSASCLLCQLEACPQDRPFCSPVGCVYDCPNDFYINGTHCVLDCADWFTSNRQCVKNCPASTFIKETLKRFGSKTYLEKKCVRSCNNDYIYNGYCFRACPITAKFIHNSTCVKECPPEKRFKDNFEIRKIIYTRCVDSCGKKAYEENNICTNTCSDGKVVSNNSCLDGCPILHQFVESGFCVANCSSVTVYIKNNVCLKTCPDEKPVFLNGSCVEVCPHGFPYTEERGNNHHCVNKCTSGKYVLNSTCITKCPKHYFVEGQVCVQKCGQNNPLIFNRSVVASKGCEYFCTVDFALTCVSSCPPRLFNHDNDCVNICPTQMYVLVNSCVPMCPESLPFSRKENTTVEVWETFHNSEKSDLVSRRKEIQRCVSKCKEYEVALNGSCLKSCPKTHRFIVNGVCTSEQCKSPYMYNTSNGIMCTDSCGDGSVISKGYCVQHCPVNEHKYHNTCVINCPSDKQYVENKTMSSGCEHYSYFSRITLECKQMDIFTQCTQSCPSNSTFVYNSNCLTVCPKGMVTFKTRCRESCPISHPIKEPWTFVTNYWSISNQYSFGENARYQFRGKSVQTTRCVQECKNPKYPFSPPTQSCVQKCPNSARYIFLNTCVDFCPKGMFLNRTKMDTKCVRECSDSKPLYDGQCLDKCPLNKNNETMYIYDKKCVSACPPQRPYGLTNKPFLCIRRCNDGRAFKDGICVDDSECIHPYFVNGHLCVKKCPSGYFWYNECLPVWSFCAALLTTLAVLSVFVRCGKSVLKDSHAVLVLIFSKEKRKRFFVNAEANIGKYWKASRTNMGSSCEVNIPLLPIVNENENFENEDSAEDVV